MEGTLDAAAANHVVAPKVALHRMNRTEYANAIWDLLRVRVKATQILPPDDESDGFNNVADVLQVSPAFVDAYISAGRQVAVEALGDRNAKAVGVQFAADPGVSGNQEFHVDGLPLGTRGGTQVTYNFPADGTYELSVGNLAAALWVTNLEFKNHLIATYDGKKFFDTNVGGEADLKSIDQKQDPAVDAINARSSASSSRPRPAHIRWRSLSSSAPMRPRRIASRRRYRAAFRIGCCASGVSRSRAPSM